MYRYLDALLKAEKEKIRTAFNRLSVTGFDELNVISTKKTTQAMYDKFVVDNEAMYLKSAKTAYKSAVKSAKSAGYSGEETEVDVGFLEGVLTGYNLVTGYLYSKETDRKRLRLNEQILTAREYNNGTMFQESLRKAANLWWTQTVQYGISTVDEATLKAFKDMGVKEHLFTLSTPTLQTVSALLPSDGWYVDEVRFFAVLAPLAFDVRRDCVFAEHAHFRGDALYRVLKYIDEHFTENITLSSVAAALGIHPVSVSRIISKSTDTTFNKHLQSTRCLFAERLIRQGELSFSEISYEAGFGSIRSFNRVFFEIHGLTPGEYKRVCERLTEKTKS